MKRLKAFSASLALIFAFFIAHVALSQVAIGTGSTPPSPSPNAVLLLVGNGSQGLVIPTINNITTAPGVEGMIAYSNGQVYYYNGTAWSSVSSGGGGGPGLIQINGNTITLGVGSSSVNLAGGFSSTTRGFLYWNGTAWVQAQFALPSTTQALVYNPTNSAWEFQAISGGGGSVTSVTGTAPITVTGTTAPAVSIANAGITNSLLANDAVNAAKIQDGTVTGADIAASTITGDKLADNGVTSVKIADGTIANADISTAAAIAVSKLAPGTNGQVLTTVGTVPTWQASAAPTILNNGQILIGNGTANSAALLSGDATLSSTGALSIANTGTAGSNIVNAINNGSTTGTIPVARGGTGAGSFPTNGVLIGNGASAISTVPVGASGQVLTLNTGLVPTWQNAAGLTNPMTATGDIIYGGTVTAGVAAPTRLAGAAGFLKSTGAAAPAYSSINLASSADVTGTLPVANGGTGVTTAANGQLLIGNGTGFTAATLTAGTNTSITNGAGTITINSTGLGSTLNSANIFVGNGSNVATGVAMSGDVGISNTGLTTIQAGAVSGGLGGEITDGTITNDDIATGAGIAGTKINANFGLGNIATTGTLNVSGGATLSNTSLQIGAINYVWPATQAAGTVLTNDGAGVLSWAPPDASKSWSLEGNVIGSGEFIGTTNANTNPLNIRVNGEMSGKIDAVAPANTFFGYQSGSVMTTGNSNAAFGYQALSFNTAGESNTAFGYRALFTNTAGVNNTANGFISLSSNTGSSNTASGHQSLYQNTTGSNNTALGASAGLTNTVGNNNTFIGYGANAGGPGFSNATAIGYSAVVGAGNSLVLGGTGANAVNVGIGTTTPVNLLHVNGTSANEGMIRITNTATGTTASDGIEISLNSSIGHIRNREGTMVVGAGTNDVIHVTPGGNVGLNMAAPAAELDVSGNINNNGKVTRTASGIGNDMLPIAYVFARGSGTGITINRSSTNVTGAVRTGPGVYDFTITGEDFTGFPTTTASYIVVGSILGSVGHIFFTSDGAISTALLRVQIFSGGGTPAPADRTFNFVVYKP
jgi:hypothetical protein